MCSESLESAGPTQMLMCPLPLPSPLPSFPISLLSLPFFLTPTLVGLMSYFLFCRA